MEEKKKKKNNFWHSFIRVTGERSRFFFFFLPTGWLL
jgi:hypothetical protein